MGSECCKCHSDNREHTRNSSLISSNSGYYDRRTRNNQRSFATERYKPYNSRKKSSLMIRQLTQDDSGHYCAESEDSYGTSLLASIDLNVDKQLSEVPTFLKRLHDVSVKIGARSRFLVEIDGLVPFKVTWYRDNQLLRENERFTFLDKNKYYCLDIAWTTLQDEGHWTCIAENKYGCSVSSAYLTILVPKAYRSPQFVEDLKAISSEDGAVSLECKVIGVPTPTLLWYKDGKKIKAGDTFALRADSNDVSSLGTYSCVAKNCLGQAFSSSSVHIQKDAISSDTSIFPLGPRPKFIRELQNAEAQIEAPLTLSCQVVVPPWPKTIDWYNKTGKITEDSRYKVLADGLGMYGLEIRSIEMIDDGEWKCVATSFFGIKAYTSCYVTVKFPKTYKTPKFLENLQAVMTPEGLVSFECKVIGYPTPQLRWLKDGKELRPGDVYQLTGTNSLGSYCCIAKNCMGEIKSTTVLTLEDIQGQLTEEERLLIFAANQPPYFIKGLKSFEAKINEELEFSVQVSAKPDANVLWYQDNEPIEQNERITTRKENHGVFTLHFKRLEMQDQAEWKCVAVNDYGQSVTSCFIKLSIPRHFKAPKFLEELKATFTKEGTVNLECKVIGVPQPELKWYKDGKHLKPGEMHKIISGGSGRCCLGNYACEATNCMATTRSSASLLALEEPKQVNGIQRLNELDLLSIITEERTSQMNDISSDKSGTYEEAVGPSFSFDGKEVSISLYETPDLTDEEALQIVEMYAEELTEHISDQNIVELPSLRFVKETLTSGNILMEATVIDIPMNEFPYEEELKTDADVENSLMDDSAQVALAVQTETLPYRQKEFSPVSEHSQSGEKSGKSIITLEKIDVNYDEADVSELSELENKSCTNKYSLLIKNSFEDDTLNESSVTETAISADIMTNSQSELQFESEESKLDKKLHSKKSTTMHKRMSIDSEDDSLHEFEKLKNKRKVSDSVQSSNEKKMRTQNSPLPLEISFKTKQELSEVEKQLEMSLINREHVLILESISCSVTSIENDLKIIQRHLIGTNQKESTSLQLLQSISQPVKEIKNEVQLIQNQILSNADHHIEKIVPVVSPSLAKLNNILAEMKKFSQSINDLTLQRTSQTLLNAITNPINNINKQINSLNKEGCQLQHIKLSTNTVEMIQEMKNYIVVFQSLQNIIESSEIFPKSGIDTIKQMELIQKLGISIYENADETVSLADLTKFHNSVIKYFDTNIKAFHKLQSTELQLYLDDSLHFKTEIDNILTVTQNTSPLTSLSYLSTSLDSYSSNSEIAFKRLAFSNACLRHLDDSVEIILNSINTIEKCSDVEKSYQKKRILMTLCNLKTPLQDFLVQIRNISSLEDFDSSEVYKVINNISIPLQLVRKEISLLFHQSYSGEVLDLVALPLKNLQDEISSFHNVIILKEPSDVDMDQFLLILNKLNSPFCELANKIMQAEDMVLQESPIVADPKLGIKIVLQSVSSLVNILTDLQNSNHSTSLILSNLANPMIEVKNSLKIINDQFYEEDLEKVNITMLKTLSSPFNSLQKQLIDVSPVLTGDLKNTIKDLQRTILTIQDQVSFEYGDEPASIEYNIMTLQTLLQPINILRNHCVALMSEDGTTALLCQWNEQMKTIDQIENILVSMDTKNAQTILKLIRNYKNIIKLEGNDCFEMLRQLNNQCNEIYNMNDFHELKPYIRRIQDNFERISETKAKNIIERLLSSNEDFDNFLNVLTTYKEEDNVKCFIALLQSLNIIRTLQESVKDTQTTNTTDSLQTPMLHSFLNTCEKLESKISDLLYVVENSSTRIPEFYSRTIDAFSTLNYQLVHLNKCLIDQSVSDDDQKEIPFESSIRSFNCLLAVVNSDENIVMAPIRTIIHDAISELVKLQSDILFNMSLIQSEDEVSLNESEFEETSVKPNLVSVCLESMKKEILKCEEQFTKMTKLQNPQTAITSINTSLESISNIVHFISEHASFDTDVDVKELNEPINKILDQANLLDNLSKANVSADIIVPQLSQLSQSFDNFKKLVDKLEPHEKSSDSPKLSIAPLSNDFPEFDNSVALSPVNFTDDSMQSDLSSLTDISNITTVVYDDDETIKQITQSNSPSSDLVTAIEKQDMPSNKSSRENESQTESCIEKSNAISYESSEPHSIAEEIEIVQDDLHITNTEQIVNVSTTCDLSNPSAIEVSELIDLTGDLEIENMKLDDTETLMTEPFVEDQSVISQIAKNIDKQTEICETEPLKLKNLESLTEENSFHLAKSIVKENIDAPRIDNTSLVVESFETAEVHNVAVAINLEAIEVNNILVVPDVTHQEEMTSRKSENIISAYETSSGICELEKTLPQNLEEAINQSQETILLGESPEANFIESHSSPRIKAAELKITEISKIDTPSSSLESIQIADYAETLLNQKANSLSKINDETLIMGDENTPFGQETKSFSDSENATSSELAPLADISETFDIVQDMQPEEVNRKNEPDIILPTDDESEKLETQKEVQDEDDGKQETSQKFLENNYVDVKTVLEVENVFIKEMKQEINESNNKDMNQHQQAELNNSLVLELTECSEIVDVVVPSEDESDQKNVTERSVEVQEMVTAVNLQEKESELEESFQPNEIIPIMTTSNQRNELRSISQKMDAIHESDSTIVSSVVLGKEKVLPESELVLEESESKYDDVVKQTIEEAENLIDEVQKSVNDSSDLVIDQPISEKKYYPVMYQALENLTTKVTQFDSENPQDYATVTSNLAEFDQSKTLGVTHCAVETESSYLCEPVEVLEGAANGEQMTITSVENDGPDSKVFVNTMRIEFMPDILVEISTDTEDHIKFEEPHVIPSTIEAEINLEPEFEQTEQKPIFQKSSVEVENTEQGKSEVTEHQINLLNVEETTVQEENQETMIPLLLEIEDQNVSIEQITNEHQKFTELIDHQMGQLPSPELVTVMSENVSFLETKSIEKDSGVCHSVGISEENSNQHQNEPLVISQHDSLLRSESYDLPSISEQESYVTAVEDFSDDNEAIWESFDSDNTDEFYNKAPKRKTVAGLPQLLDESEKIVITSGNRKTEQATSEEVKNLVEKQYDKAEKFDMEMENAEQMQYSSKNVGIFGVSQEIISGQSMLESEMMETPNKEQKQKKETIFIKKNEVGYPLSGNNMIFGSLGENDLDNCMLELEMMEAIDEIQKHAKETSPDENTYKASFPTENEVVVGSSQANVSESVLENDEKEKVSRQQKEANEIFCAERTIEIETSRPLSGNVMNFGSLREKFLDEQLEIYDSAEIQNEEPVISSTILPQRKYFDKELIPKNEQIHTEYIDQGEESIPLETPADALTIIGSPLEMILDKSIEETIEIEKTIAISNEENQEPVRLLSGNVMIFGSFRENFLDEPIHEIDHTKVINEKQEQTNETITSESAETVQALPRNVSDKSMVEIEKTKQEQKSNKAVPNEENQEPVHLLSKNVMVFGPSKENFFNEPTQKMDDIAAINKKQEQRNETISTEESADAVQALQESIAVVDSSEPSQEKVSNELIVERVETERTEQTQKLIETISAKENQELERPLSGNVITYGSSRQHFLDESISKSDTNEATHEKEKANEISIQESVEPMQVLSGNVMILGCLSEKFLNDQDEHVQDIAQEKNDEAATLCHTNKENGRSVCSVIENSINFDTSQEKLIGKNEMETTNEDQDQAKITISFDGSSEQLSSPSGNVMVFGCFQEESYLDKQLEKELITKNFELAENVIKSSNCEDKIETLSSMLNTPQEEILKDENELLSDSIRCETQKNEKLIGAMITEAKSISNLDANLQNLFLSAPIEEETENNQQAQNIFEYKSLDMKDLLCSFQEAPMAEVFITQTTVMPPIKDNGKQSKINSFSDATTKEINLYAASPFINEEISLQDEELKPLLEIAKKVEEATESKMIEKEKSECVTQEESSPKNEKPKEMIFLKEKGNNPEKKSSVKEEKKEAVERLNAQPDQSLEKLTNTGKTLLQKEFEPSTEISKKEEKATEDKTIEKEKAEGVAQEGLSLNNKNPEESILITEKEKSLEKKSSVEERKKETLETSNSQNEKSPQKLTGTEETSLQKELELSTEISKKKEKDTKNEMFEKEKAEGSTQEELFLKNDNPEKSIFMNEKEESLVKKSSVKKRKKETVKRSSSQEEKSPENMTNTEETIEISKKEKKATENEIIEKEKTLEKKSLAKESQKETIEQSNSQKETSSEKLTDIKEISFQEEELKPLTEISKNEEKPTENEIIEKEKSRAVLQEELSPKNEELIFINENIISLKERKKETVERSNRQGKKSPEKLTDTEEIASQREPQPPTETSKKQEDSTENRMIEKRKSDALQEESSLSKNENPRESISKIEKGNSFDKTLSVKEKNIETMERLSRQKENSPEKLTNSKETSLQEEEVKPSTEIAKKIEKTTENEIVEKGKFEVSKEKSASPKNENPEEPISKIKKETSFERKSSVKKKKIETMQRSSSQKEGSHKKLKDVEGNSSQVGRSKLLIEIAKNEEDASNENEIIEKKKSDDFFQEESSLAKNKNPEELISKIEKENSFDRKSSVKKKKKESVGRSNSQKEEKTEELIENKLKENRKESIAKEEHFLTNEEKSDEPSSQMIKEICSGKSLTKNLQSEHLEKCEIRSEESKNDKLKYKSDENTDEKLEDYSTQTEKKNSETSKNEKVEKLINSHNKTGAPESILNKEEVCKANKKNSFDEKEENEKNFNKTAEEKPVEKNKSTNDLTKDDKNKTLKTQKTNNLENELDKKEMEQAEQPTVCRKVTLSDQKAESKNENKELDQKTSSLEKGHAKNKDQTENQPNQPKRLSASKSKGSIEDTNNAELEKSESPGNNSQKSKENCESKLISLQKKISTSELENQTESVTEKLKLEEKIGENHTQNSETLKKKSDELIREESENLNETPEVLSEKSIQPPKDESESKFSKKATLPNRQTSKDIMIQNDESKSPDTIVIRHEEKIKDALPKKSASIKKEKSNDLSAQTESSVIPTKKQKSLEEKSESELQEQTENIKEQNLTDEKVEITQIEQKKLGSLENSETTVEKPAKSEMCEIEALQNKAEENVKDKKIDETEIEHRKSENNEKETIPDKSSAMEDEKQNMAESKEDKAEKKKVTKDKDSKGKKITEIETEIVIKNSEKNKPEQEIKNEANNDKQSKTIEKLASSKKKKSPLLNHKQSKDLEKSKLDKENTKSKKIEKTEIECRKSINHEKETSTEKSASEEKPNILESKEYISDKKLITKRVDDNELKKSKATKTELDVANNSEKGEPAEVIEKTADKHSISLLKKIETSESLKMRKFSLPDEKQIEALDKSKIGKEKSHDEQIKERKNNKKSSTEKQKLEIKVDELKTANEKKNSDIEPPEKFKKLEKSNKRIKEPKSHEKVHLDGFHFEPSSTSQSPSCLPHTPHLSDTITANYFINSNHSQCLNNINLLIDSIHLQEKSFKHYSSSQDQWHSEPMQLDTYLSHKKQNLFLDIYPKMCTSKKEHFYTPLKFDYKQDGVNYQHLTNYKKISSSNSHTFHLFDRKKQSLEPGSFHSHTSRYDTCHNLKENRRLYDNYDKFASSLRNIEHFEDMNHSKLGYNSSFYQSPRKFDASHRHDFVKHTYSDWNHRTGIPYNFCSSQEIESILNRRLHDRNPRSHIYFLDIIPMHRPIIHQDKNHLFGESRFTGWNILPTFKRLCADNMVPVGATLALHAEVEGTPKPDVEWLREDESLPKNLDRFRYIEDSGLHTLLITDVSYNEAGKYSCKAYNKYGIANVITNVFVIRTGGTRGGKPPMFISRPETILSVNSGSDVSVSFRLSGDPRPKVIWMKGLTDITMTHRTMKETVNDYTRLILKRAQISDSGTYFIIAKNEFGTDRVFFTLRVNQRSRSLTPIPTYRREFTTPFESSRLSHHGHKVPGAIPTEPYVLDCGKNWLTLTWSKPKDNGGAPILAYRVECWLAGEDGGAKWTELGMTPSNTFDAFNLETGKKYNFRVTARNQYGWGEPAVTSSPILVEDFVNFPEFEKGLPGQLKILANSSIELECKLKNENGTQIEWHRDGIAIEENENCKITRENGRCLLQLDNVQECDSGRYVCEAFNKYGRVCTFVRLMVVDDPKIVATHNRLNRIREGCDGKIDLTPQFTMRLRNRRVEMTYPVRLTCQVIGYPKPKVSWFKDGQSLHDDQHFSIYEEADGFQSLEICRSMPEHTGTYNITASNNSGSVSCKCDLLVDKGIRTYIEPKFVEKLDMVYSTVEDIQLRIKALVQAYPSVGITWQKNGIRLRPSRRIIITLDHDGRTELTIANVKPQDSGIYTCTATNAIGSAETNTRIEVFSKQSQLTDLKSRTSNELYSKEPKFLVKPRSCKAHEGDHVIIECEIIGDPKPHVTWLRDRLKLEYYRDCDDFKLSSADSYYQLEIPRARFDHTGAYTVTANNEHGESKAIVSLQVYSKDLLADTKTEAGMSNENMKYSRVEKMPKIKKNLSDIKCCDGDSATFECEIHTEGDTSNVDFRWYKNGRLIPLGNDFEAIENGSVAKLIIKHVYPEDEGRYSCIANNNLGNAETTACLIVDVPEEKENLLSKQLNRPAGFRSRGSTPLTVQKSPSRRISPSEDTSVCTGHRFHRKTAPKFYAVLHNKIAELGQTVKFQCAISGHPEPTTTWDKNDKPISSTSRISIQERDDLRILEIFNVTGEDEGLYRIIVKNEVGRCEATARLDIMSHRSRQTTGMRTHTSDGSFSRHAI